MATIEKKPLDVSMVEVWNAGEKKFRLKITVQHDENRFTRYTFDCDDWYLKQLATGITEILSIRRRETNSFIDQVKRALPYNNGEGAKIV